MSVTQGHNHPKSSGMGCWAPSRCSRNTTPFPYRSLGITFSILKMGKLRPREAKGLAQGHMPGEYGRVRTKSSETTSSSFQFITVSDPACEYGIPGQHVKCRFQGPPLLRVSDSATSGWETRIWVYQASQVDWEKDLEEHCFNLPSCCAEKLRLGESKGHLVCR